MTTQTKMMDTNLKPWLDMILVALSVFVGGLITLLGLWLWFDYQTDPTRSLLAIFSTNLAAVLPLSLRQSLDGQAQLMGLPLTGETSAYWYMARAGGIVAYLLLWFSVVWGLALSSKLTTNRVPAPVVYGLHEFLSLGAVGFALLHSLVLLGDSYINFSLINLVLPYTAPYEPFWTGLGTIGFYLIAALTASFYVRKKIGQQTWRALHYLTFAGFALVLTHGLMAGTDTTLPVIKLMYLSTGGLVLFLTLYRMLTPKRKPVRAIQ